MNIRLIRFLSASFSILLSLALVPTKASAINLSIGIGGEVLPGVYGTVNIDNGRYPALVYAEPLIVTRPSRVLAPIHLHVPPGHLRRWDRYCGRYHACSQPVYFVRSPDYNGFSPRYAEPRHVHHDRITYIYRGDNDRRGYRDDHVHRHRDHHPGHGKHWRGRDE